MRRPILKIAIMALALSLIFTGSAFAWGESHPRAMAMGGAYTALSTGHEATAYNPANLGLSGSRRFTLDIVGIGLSAKNNSFSLADYKKYNGQFLNDDDKADILDKIPSDGLKLNGLAEANALSFSVSRFAVSFRTLGASRISLDKDPIELLLYGNAVKSEVNLNETRGEAYAIGDGAISYGHPLMQWPRGELAVGATMHYLYGIAYQKIIHAEGGVATTQDGFDGDGTMIIRSGLGGHGFAFDLGVSMVFQDNWIFSAGWQNMYSLIKWGRKTEETLYAFEMTEPIDFGDIADDNSDSLVESSDTTYGIPAFSTKIPSVVKLGLARKYEKFTWAIDWEQGTSSGALQSVTPRIGAGFEYRLAKYLPVRLGTSFGGDRGTIISTGFGLNLGPYQLDFAFANNGSLNPGATKGAHFALAMGLNF